MRRFLHVHMHAQCASICKITGDFAWCVSNALWMPIKGCAFGRSLSLNTSGFASIRFQLLQHIMQIWHGDQFQFVARRSEHHKRHTWRSWERYWRQWHPWGCSRQVSRAPCGREYLHMVSPLRCPSRWGGDGTGVMVTYNVRSGRMLICWGHESRQGTDDFTNQGKREGWWIHLNVVPSGMLAA